MDALLKVPFFVILSIHLRQIFQLPELPEHSSANVTYVMVSSSIIFISRIDTILSILGSSFLGRFVLPLSHLYGGCKIAIKFSLSARVIQGGQKVQPKNPKVSEKYIFGHGDLS